SVVPGGAVTWTVIDLCFAPSIAMLSPTVSRPGWPLLRTQCATSFPGPGGAFGSCRCPDARVLQIEQLSICGGVFGSWLSLTIVIVCGSSEGFPPYSKVSIEPDFTVVVAGEKYIVSVSCRLMTYVDPLSVTFTMTPVS